jgi:hypothetical protein
MKNKKVVSIILEQCDKLAERCEGYREEVKVLVSEILEYERNHRISPTSIQKKINDKFNATSKFLAVRRGYDIGIEEDEL